MNLALLALSTEFEAPTTHDFSRWFDPNAWMLGPWQIGPFEIGLNFIYLLVLMAMATFVLSSGASCAFK